MILLIWRHSCFTPQASRHKAVNELGCLAVVQAGKDFTYLVVIIAGFAVAGFLFWSVGSEFFSQNSPSVVYSRALTRVKSDPQVSCHFAELSFFPVVKKIPLVWRSNYHDSIRALISATNSTCVAGP